MNTNINIFVDSFLNFFLHRNGSYEREENGHESKGARGRSKLIVLPRTNHPPDVFFFHVGKGGSYFYFLSSFRRLSTMPSQPVKHIIKSVDLKWGRSPFRVHLATSGDVFGYHTGSVGAAGVR